MNSHESSPDQQLRSRIALVFGMQVKRISVALVDQI